MPFSSSLGYIKHTGTPKGYGVFASRAIRAGEIVERCPVIILSMPFDELPMALKRAVFNWSAVGGDSDSRAIALGYGGMYNHANPANVHYEAMPGLPCLRFTAARDIDADEEISVNYNTLGGGIASDKDSWFDAVGVAPWTE